MKHKTKGRKDHYLPQGYLRGFIDPLRVKEPKPLWHFDIHHKKWSERSTSEVGRQKGFYDYAGTVRDVETDDEAFAELERSYSQVRKDLILTSFANWLDRRDFLLRYMQMIRARSPLYFEQKRAEGRVLDAWEVVEVGPAPNQMKVRPTKLPDRFIKNKAITDMRSEIQKGADWLNGFDWALRYTDSPDNPVIGSDHPFVVEGKVATINEAMQHPDTLLYFPLCWQACLFGSRLSFNLKTDRFVPEDLKKLRKKYSDNARSYLVSPTQLSFV